MLGDDCSPRFDLDDDAIFHYQISAVCAQVLPMKPDIKGNLAVDSDASELK